MRLRPIRPPARLPTLWQRHPELAPPRRRRQRCFPGRSGIGWTVHPFSGASNLRGAAPNAAPPAKRQRSLAPTDAVITAADACCCVAPARRSQQLDHGRSWQNASGTLRKRIAIEFDGI